MTDDYAIFPAHQAVEAIRSSGYKDTPYALFELIDNSVEGGASDIHVAAIAKTGKTGVAVEQIVVLDNGEGMDSHTLRQGLQYGNGTKLALPPSQRKLGRFGVGLPASTFSQCRRLDAYSWQNGITNALRVHVDLDHVQEKQIHAVPEPELHKLPDDILRLFPCVEGYTSGTLIVWGKVDRNSPKKPATIVKKTARLAGRVYRNFLSDGRVKIRLLAVQDGRSTPQDVHPVDPLFLSANPDMPKPFNREPMFQPFEHMRNQDGSLVPHRLTVATDGEFLGEVKIYAAYRSPKVLEVTQERKVKDPGTTDFGQIARDLSGVSIVRAGREIMLDRNWLTDTGTTDRWMGVTIEFDPVLDDHFGITNNKQDARRLADFARRETAEIDESDVTVKAVADKVHHLLSEMRKIIKAERRGQRGARGQPEADRELRNVTNAIEQTRPPIPNDKAAIDEGIIVEILRPTDAPEGRPIEIVTQQLRVEIATGNLGATEIFRPEARGGIMLVTLNREHPMFDSLQRALSPDDSEEKMEARLHDAEWVLNRLLVSYSRAEVETETKPSEKQEFESVRSRWGRVASDIFKHDK